MKLGIIRGAASYVDVLAHIRDTTSLNILYNHTISLSKKCAQNVDSALTAKYRVRDNKLSIEQVSRNKHFIIHCVMPKWENTET